MIANDNGNGNGNRGVLPEGVRVCPEAEESLERALDCLRGGLTVAALHHTEWARAYLDKATEGPVEGKPNKT